MKPDSLTYDCPPPVDADELDESTVLEPEDVEVRELLAEIDEWERSRT